MRRSAPFRFLLQICAAACVLSLAACKPKTAPKPPPAEPPPAAGLDAGVIKAHVAFLADDAQEGRAPGTEADGRVQEYIESAFKGAGLEPGFGDSFRQTFQITDGVKIRTGGDTILDVSGIGIPHSVMPFTTDTARSGPIVAKFVFVGHGIAKNGKFSGDYEKIGRKVKGNIAVALHGGPKDAKLTSSHTRPQTKLIAARDHGATGFVLWDPTASSPYPNHGKATDLQIPAVFVGAEGTVSLLKAFGRKSLKDGEAVEPARLLKPGVRTRKLGTVQTHVEPRHLDTANVAGKIPAGEGGAGKAIIIGAHMDHLGLGTSSSLAPGERAVHNGADDNASGVAVMLEVCKSVAALEAAKRPFDVWCVAFAAEEMGLLGSKFFVEKLDPTVKDAAVAMLNFDMVGRLGGEGLIVAGAGTSSAWPALLDKHKGDLQIRATDDGYGPSDHGSFYEAGIPVLHFFTGPHEDYHKPSDDTDKVNFDGAAKVGMLALGIVTDILDTKLEPDYKETERPTRRAGGFKVSLGTIPDYAAKVDGVKLSGVRKGGPAQKGGLAKGDVIKKIGDRDVHNLDDYMAAFAEMTAGTEVTFVVERAGKTVDIKITPEAPRDRGPDAAPEAKAHGKPEDKPHREEPKDDKGKPGEGKPGKGTSHE